VRACSGRSKDDVGYIRDTVKLVELDGLRIPMIADDIHELGLGITCGWCGLGAEECILLYDINCMAWSGYHCYLLFVYRICLFCGLVGLMQIILSKDKESPS
jgi:hypothetical protein